MHHPTYGFAAYRYNQKHIILWFLRPLFKMYKKKKIINMAGAESGIVNYN